MKSHHAKYRIGQIVRHREHPFRGVIFDVDPEFDRGDDWLEAIPEDKRPHREQPFYHLLAENESTYYVAYVSEQNLVEDAENGPVGHPDVEEMFGTLEGGLYRPYAPLN